MGEVDVQAANRPDKRRNRIILFIILDPSTARLEKEALVTNDREAPV